MPNRRAINRAPKVSLVVLIAVSCGIAVSISIRDHALAQNTISQPSQEPVKRGIQVSGPAETQKLRSLLNRNGKDHALFFATDDYDHWPHLNNPIDDGQAIADELKNYYG